MSKYFSERETACRCCGENKMDPQFMVEIDKLRKMAGFPFIVSSGYRCPNHNDDVSSSGHDGPHTTGRAIDISVTHQQAHVLLRLALYEGFTGIGINQKGGDRFIHLDNLPNGYRQPRPHVWSY